MMTIEDLIAVVSLVLTAFGLGYSIGSNKSQKLMTHRQYQMQILTLILSSVVTT